MPNKKIKITKNGPYLVSGNVPMSEQIIETNEEGIPIDWAEGKNFPVTENYSLCRCGKSKNKPYCDGTHVTIDFDGEETAGFEKYETQAERIEGPEMDLTDYEELCAGARFCDFDDRVWELVEETDIPKKKKIFIDECAKCPSGRLVAIDKKTGFELEPDLDKSIGLVEDPEAKCSGPIWVRGGIPIQSAEGKEYEIRNQVTLCRCGKSENKPFCDGSHIRVGFKAKH